MKIYHYDETGLFKGEGLADESPLEPGVFLIPANATETKPPAPGENELVRFVDGKWAKEAKPLPPEPPVKTAEEIKAEANDLILGQIATLEFKQARAVREALLNKPGSVDRLAQIDADIAALRSQIQA